MSLCEAGFGRERGMSGGSGTQVLYGCSILTCWQLSNVQNKYTLEARQEGSYEETSLFFAIVDLLDPINLKPDDDDEPEKLGETLPHDDSDRFRCWGCLTNIRSIISAVLVGKEAFVKCHMDMLTTCMHCAWVSSALVTAPSVPSDGINLCQVSHTFKLMPVG
ncbi:hypothetical protein DFH07DRAFT_766893 [Mycena maculata]|uniref:Uncharacterized protein n=1 Tax=Mycena maculata TaxID=230809 RepID=A0AAD7K0U3_9AGAR|nr:hypothetical protein DFH07DRAFT_766893 [Mycena maculata]